MPRWLPAAVCVLAGACSFRPGIASSDAALGDGADANANADANVDATGDASVDAMPQPAAFAVATVASGTTVSTLTYPLTIPAGTNRFLIVAVQLGATCPAGTVPNITGVTYNAIALASITSIIGTPCGTGTTRSDQWQLVAPATGTHDVVVTLSGAAATIHSGAIAFTGIDQTTPVRGSATASGAGTSSSVAVTSAVGDLVVNTVGQGNSITAPGAGQTSRYLHNVNAANTLNNSAASTAPGAATVTMTWTFGASDQWQTISTSLRP